MSSKTKQRKVAIFGLLPQQQNIIKQEFDDDFDLSFNKDDVGMATTAISKSADSIILMVRFMSHKQKQTIDRNKCLYCTGGMSSLREMLSELRVETGEEKVSATISQQSLNEKVVKHIDPYDMPITPPEDFVFALRMVLEEMGGAAKGKDDIESVIDLVGGLMNDDLMAGDYTYDCEFLWRKSVRTAASIMSSQGSLIMSEDLWMLVSVEWSEGNK